jgi:tetratricopeptide (TPR) repeat protein
VKTLKKIAVVLLLLGFVGVLSPSSVAWGEPQTQEPRAQEPQDREIAAVNALTYAGMRMVRAKDKLMIHYVLDNFMKNVELHDLLSHPSLAAAAGKTSDVLRTKEPSPEERKEMLRIARLQEQQVLDAALQPSPATQDSPLSSFAWANTFTAIAGSESAFTRYERGEKLIEGKVREAFEAMKGTIGREDATDLFETRMTLMTEIWRYVADKKIENTSYLNERQVQQLLDAIDEPEPQNALRRFGEMDSDPVWKHFAPYYWYAGSAAELAGNNAKALVYYEKFHEYWQPVFEKDFYKANVLLRQIDLSGSGLEDGKLRAMLAQIRENLLDDNGVLLKLSGLYADIGDTDTSLSLLQRAFDNTQLDEESFRTLSETVSMMQSLSVFKIPFKVDIGKFNHVLRESVKQLREIYHFRGNKILFQRVSGSISVTGQDAEITFQKGEFVGLVKAHIGLDINHFLATDTNDGECLIRVRLVPFVDKDWQIRTGAVFEDLIWLRRPNVDILGLSLGFVNNRLRSSMLTYVRDNIGKLDEFVSRKVDLRAQLQKLWADASKPVDVDGKTFLSLSPKVFAAEPLTVDGNDIVLPMMLLADSQLLPGPNPVWEPVSPDTLPPLLTTLPNVRGVKIRISQVIPYRVFEEKLQGQSFDVEGKPAVLESVSIAKKDDGDLLFEIGLLPTLSTESEKVDCQVLARPIWGTEYATLRLHVVGEGPTAADASRSLLLKRLYRYLEKQEFDLKAETAKDIDALNEKLGNLELRSDVRLSGQIARMDVHGGTIEEEGVRLDSSVLGTADLIYTPASFAK